MNQLGPLVPHGGFYHVDWQGVGWWQRLITIPHPSETALLALQHIDVELSDPTESFNHETDLILGFSAGFDIKQAITRMSDPNAPRLADMSGVVVRRMGRMLSRHAPLTDLIKNTARERGLSRVVFSIPGNKPDARYEQFARQHDCVLDTSGPQRLWVHTVASQE